MHYTMLHGMQCIQSHCMESTAFNPYQFYQAAWNQLHSMDLHCTTCIESTAFNNAAWNPLHSIGIHWATLHGIHCIHSGSISQRWMESTALNLDAWNPLLNWYQLHNSAGNPLHSIGIHCRMLHGFHCMQPGYIAPRCMQSTAFTLDVFHNTAWNPVHSIIPHVIQYINQDQLGHAAWIHCNQSVSVTPSCMESTSFNRDTLHHSA